MPRPRLGVRRRSMERSNSNNISLNYGSDDEYEAEPALFPPVRSRSSCGNGGSSRSLLLHTRSDHQHTSMHYRRRKRRPAEPQQPTYSFDDSCIGSVESSCSDSTRSGGSRSPPTPRRELSHNGGGLGAPPAVEMIMGATVDTNNPTGSSSTTPNHHHMNGSVRKRPSPPGATKSSESPLPLSSSHSLHQQQHYRTLPSSLSFRRKKTKKKVGLPRKLFRRLDLSRMSVGLAALFAMAFGMAYISNLTSNSIASMRRNSAASNNAHHPNIRGDYQHAGAVVVPPPPPPAPIVAMASADQTNAVAAADAIGPVSRRILPGLVSRVLDWTWGGGTTTPTREEKAETYRTLFPEKKAQIPKKEEAVHQPEISKPLKTDKNENKTRLRGAKRKNSLEIYSADEKAQFRQINKTADDRESVHAPIRRGDSTSTDKAKQTAVDDLFHFQRHFDNAPVCHALTPDQVDFTLVTQLSLNRLWMLEHHCNRWGHGQAISLAVYVGNDVGVSVQDISDQLHNMGCALERVAVQTVSGYSAEEYPVNALRNKALSAVKTSHVMYVDVDFWESMDLYENLQNHKDVLAADPHLALVIPAFQIARQCAEWRDCREKNIPNMPDDRDELLELMVKRVADAFDPTNSGGHGSTRYREWLDQEPGELLPIECVNSNRYEPYLVFRYCHDLPPFQEAFTGYGKNKMTWVMQLRRAGYHISQMGHSFLVHYPHLDSKARMHWNGGQGGAPMHKPRDAASLAELKRGQVDHTFVQFRRWLESTVPDETVMHKCVDAMNDDVKLWVEPSEHEQAEATNTEY